jgi:hypothetical protein
MAAGECSSCAAGKITNIATNRVTGVLRCS